MDEEEELRRVLAAAAGEKTEPHRLTPEKMAEVVIALRAGASLDEAAKAAGFAAETVQRWRKRSAVFDAACAEAIEATSVPRLVAVADGKGGYQLRRGRRNKFTARRKQIFLEYFAATLDAVAAADAAGVCFATAYAHRRTDPAFAAGWAEAADIGVEQIGEEIGRQRLAAAQAMRVSGAPPAEIARSESEFERTMAFLKHWSGRQRGGALGGPPLTKWSEDEAFAALDRALAVYRRKKAREQGDGT